MAMTRWSAGTKVTAQDCQGCELRAAVSRRGLCGPCEQVMGDPGFVAHVDALMAERWATLRIAGRVPTGASDRAGASGLVWQSTAIDAIAEFMEDDDEFCAEGPSDHPTTGAAGS